MMCNFFSRRDLRPEPVAVLLPEPLGAEVDALLAAGQFVPAVRLVRERTQLGLLVATRAVRHRDG